jgi:hypothetical protein
MVSHVAKFAAQIQGFPPGLMGSHWVHDSMGFGDQTKIIFLSFLDIAKKTIYYLLLMQIQNANQVFGNPSYDVCKGFLVNICHMYV